jgi:hypothetical protein
VTANRVVDPVNQTVSFCAPHLSIYVSTVDGYNSQLTVAHYGSAVQLQDRMGPGDSYLLHLEFFNNGSQTWTASTVTAEYYDPSNPGAVSPWGTTTLQLVGVAGVDGGGPQPIAPGEGGVFEGTITAPSVAGLYALGFATHTFASLDGGAPTDIDFGSYFLAQISVATEICNGIDDDGNGLIDDNVPPQACYDGPPGTENVSFCHGGTRACVGGTYASSPCIGEVLPAPEVCNGMDDDCNNIVDDLPPRACYFGPAGTEGVGPCHGGMQTCVGGSWAVSPCVGEVLPTSEICNGIDDNCNNAVDDRVPPAPCYDGLPGTENVGICHGGGRACVGGTYANSACAGEVTPAPAEICNGLDDNCDGAVDNLPGIGGACNDPYSQGECRHGSAACIPGWSTGLTCLPSDPTPEICDGLDNDCDGHIDNETLAGGPTWCGYRINLWNIDDDLSIWRGDTASGSPAMYFHSGDSSADLCPIFDGTCGTQDIVIKIGNYGCFNSGGHVSIDRFDHNYFDRDEGSNYFPHCGFTYRWVLRFSSNPEQVTVIKEQTCGLATDCMN